mmetsp:Transcript_11832/g.37561  ORF Transcript_11832/g.37561 Transcript_11832/m.37561 type:complete len:226 (-) Transcript_11832:2232-2909(-)
MPAFATLPKLPFLLQGPCLRCSWPFETAAPSPSARCCCRTSRREGTSRPPASSVAPCRKRSALPSPFRRSLCRHSPCGRCGAAPLHLSKGGPSHWSARAAVARLNLRGRSARCTARNGWRRCTSTRRWTRRNSSAATTCRWTRIRVLHPSRGLTGPLSVQHCGATWSLSTMQTCAQPQCSTACCRCSSRTVCCASTNGGRPLFGLPRPFASSWCSTRRTVSSRDP